MIKISKILLFLSSYIPLYAILIIKNIFERISEGGKFLPVNIKKICLFNEFNDFACMILFVISLICIIVLIENINRSSTAMSYSYSIEYITNETDKYFFNYLAVYLLPCIGLSLNNIVDVVVLVLLMMIIGYIYITNEIIYINPVLGLMGYNIYHIEMFNCFDKEPDTKIVICKRKLKLVRNDVIDLVANEKFALCIRKREE